MYRLVNVTKTYGKGTNRVEVLKGVTLSFPRAGMVSILGKSGSGKSTLLNLLTGLDSPSHGEIYFQNKNLGKLKEKEKKNYQNQMIGVLFQHFNLFNDLSCLENVMLPKLVSGASQDSSKKTAKALFDKYHLMHLMNQKYGTLSGGEKQRVALLRALINNPQVIIADEPTGALDSKNSVLIMDELKELSIDHLVIVVTHNEQLIKKYEDYRIYINNGKASELKFKVDQQFRYKTNKKINHQALFKFIKLHLHNHKTRNIIASCSITFSSLCLLISLGYINGASASVNNYKKESLQYSYATIAKKTSIEVPDSPIIISKLTRPNLEDIRFINEEIKSIKIENNHQAVFPKTPTFDFDSKNIDDIEFTPVYDFSLFQKLFVSGKTPTNNDFSEAVVNEEFVRHFGYKSQNIVNHAFSLNEMVEMNNKIVSGEIIKDNIEFNQKLKIVGVVKEFSYLNTPRIYYSYLGLKEYLSNYVLMTYSARAGVTTYVEQMITLAEEDDVNSGYSYNLFVNDINEVDKLYRLKTKYDQIGGFDITSTSYTVSSSYQSMTNIVSTSLIVFVVIALIGAIFIIMITSYSNFTQNKKESAILSIIGTKKSSIFNIFNIENLLVALLGIVASIVLSLPTALIINKIIETSFHLSNLISVPLLSYIPFTILILTILISGLATMVPFLFYENGFIVEELKDE